jgi:hypothetical protein
MNEWWIPPGKTPNLGEQLYAFRWALLVVLLVVNVLVGAWLWQVLRADDPGGAVAFCLGTGGLVLLDLVGGALALYVWLRRRNSA